MLGDPVPGRAFRDAARRTVTGLVAFLGIFRPGGEELQYSNPIAPPRPRPSSGQLIGARYGMRSLDRATMRAAAAGVPRYGSPTGMPPVPRKVVFSDPLLMARLQRGYRAGSRTGPRTYSRPYTIPIPTGGTFAPADRSALPDNSSGGISMPGGLRSPAFNPGTYRG